MGKIILEHRDFSDLNQSLAKDRVYGGFVTPGAGVAVNVAALLGTIAGMGIESAGATNLAVTAGVAAGESRINSIVVSNAGAISAVAGASAAAPVVPALPANSTLLANVTVANGAAAVLQAAIDNKVRNWL